MSEIKPGAYVGAVFVLEDLGANVRAACACGTEIVVPKAHVEARRATCDRRVCGAAIVFVMHMSSFLTYDQTFGLVEELARDEERFVESLLRALRCIRCQAHVRKGLRREVDRLERGEPWDEADLRPQKSPRLAA